MSHRNRFNFSNESDKNEKTEILENEKTVKDNKIEEVPTTLELSETVESVEPVEEPLEEVTQGLLQSEEVIEPIEEPIIEEKTEVIGFVEGCDKLNVRKEANKESDIMCIIDKSTELIIDSDNSTDEFFKVTTLSGIEGYCMKKFIKIK